MINKTTLMAAVVAMSSAGAAYAAPVNGTGLVTPDTIFGSGNANGSFSGETQENVEIGLRGKLRYNLSGLPESTYNYDNNRTYTFTPAEGNAPTNRSVFNFDWSINVDQDGTTGAVLSDYTYLLEIDYDPTVLTLFTSFDPINVSVADHSIGTNSTPNNGGTEATNPTDYAALIMGNNIAQNSWNLGFFNPFFNPQTEGLYTVNLTAYSNGNQVARSSIDIQYGAIAPIPLPAALPLLLLGLGGLGLMRRRKSKTA